MENIKNKFVVWIPLLFFTTLFALFISKLVNIDKDFISPQVGIPVPHFLLSNLKDEKSLTEDDLPSKTYLLNVWASWCITCEVEHEYLKELSKILPVVGLNYKDSRKDAEKFLSELGDPYEFHIFDPSGRLGFDLGVTGAPETFLIDKEGVIKVHIRGEINSLIFMEKIFPLIAIK